MITTKEGDCIDWETEHEHREHIINECKKIRNMSNNTALQEALYDFEVLKQSSSKFSDILFLDAAMAILRTKLDKEKNDIIEAYEQGFVNAMSATTKTGTAKLTTSNQYFNNTFNK